MPAFRPVTVDLATGVVTIGGTRVALQREGAYFNASGGFRARALTFAERSLIVAGALIDPEPNRALLTKLRTLAAPIYETTDQMADALILALAGGGEPAASFAECAREACRKQGVDWQTVQQTPAVLIDQMASADAVLTSDDGWTRFEFQEMQADSASVEDCCRMMLEQLIERGTPREEAAADPDAVEPEWLAGKSEVEDSQSALGDCWSRTQSGNLPRMHTAAWPRAAQRPRARAILGAPVEASTKPAKATETPTSIGASFRSISGWPEEPSTPPVQVDAGSLKDLSGDANILAVAKLTGEVPGALTTSTKGTTTLWGSVAASTAEPPTVPVSQKSEPRKSAAIPAKARLRAHRLRDLPIRVLPRVTAVDNSPTPASGAASTSTVSEATLNARTTPAIAPQRDWIYEIATALADECDLRGLDA
jgi:hypothetical protein